MRPGEAQRGLRPDLRPLGRGRRPLPRAAVLRLEHAARQRRRWRPRLVTDPVGAIRPIDARNAADRARASCNTRADLLGCEPHARAGGARPVRVPARRLPAAPAQPGLRWRPPRRPRPAGASGTEGALRRYHRWTDAQPWRFALAPSRRGQAQLAPDALVKNVTLEVVALIAKDKEIQAGNRAKLIALIEAKVLPHFNFQAMTALAMGPELEQGDAGAEEAPDRGVPDAAGAHLRERALGLQRAEASTSGRCARRPTDTDVTVQVRVLQSGAQPVPIDYNMEKTPARLEGLRRERRRRQPGGELPHRVRQRGARVRHRRPDQEPRRRRTARSGRRRAAGAGRQKK